MNFCVQAKMCIINGRVCPLNDRFTSVSHRGKAIVDYFLTTHEGLQNVNMFKVLNLGDLITEFNAIGMCDKKPSDHNMILCQFRMSNHLQEVIEEDNCNVTAENVQNGLPQGKGKFDHPPCKFKRKQLPNEFMNTEEVIAQCSNLIDSLLAQRLDQQRVDEVYDSFVEIHMNEMSKFMKELDKTPKTKKFVSHSSKPYWTEVMTEKWKECHEAEKAFEKANKLEHGYIALKDRSNFLLHKFDKMVKQARRSYERRKVHDLEKANVEDPVAFWRAIQKLGPRKQSNIPWEVKDESGHVITDRVEVLHRWMSDFEGLLTPTDDLTVNRESF